MSRTRWIRKLGLGVGLVAALAALAVPCVIWVAPAFRAAANLSDHAASRALARARDYLNRGRPDLAIRAVSAIREPRPQAAEAFAITGLAYARMNEAAKAGEALDRSLKLNPNQAEALRVRAAIYLASGDAPRGLTLLERAAELDPTDYRAWAIMGDVHHDMTQPVKAANAFLQALKRKPREPHSRLGYIRELLVLHRADEATPLLEDALRDQPDDPRVLGYAVWHAQELNQDDRARTYAERALARDPRNFESRYHRAKIDIKTGHPQHALEDLEIAVETEPLNQGALELLAKVQAMLGMADRAEETRQRAQRTHDLRIEMDRLARLIPERPNDPEPRWRMGQVAAKSGMKTLAEQSFRAALELDPQCREARDGLAALPASAPPADSAPQTERTGR
jgi:tetratricopeptide (TPR) repeat protein